MNTREELCDILMFELPDPNPWEGEIRLLIDRLVANGVTVQKHGRWIWDANNDRYVCSECNKEPAGNCDGGCVSHLSDYCPNCGAKMDGGDAG